MNIKSTQPPARLCACGAAFVPTESQIRWRRYRCTDCTARANKKARSGDYKRKPTDTEWQREYQARPEVLARRNALLRKYRGDPVRAAKIHTRDSLRSAVRWGRMERKPCEVCGEKAEGHHEDYSKPYDVRWLCRKHHNETHHPKSNEL
jgi:DNA-directed RNA polymerase subunit RPC12/RpoP